MDPLRAPDIADEKVPRCRLLRTFGDNGPEEEPLPGGVPCDLESFAEFVLDLPCDNGVRRQLVSRVPKRERPDFGTERQRLWRHVGLVRMHARDLAERLCLCNGSEVRKAFDLAAAWHDHGKNRDIWQRAVGGGRGRQAVGKSGGSMGRVARGYRHEFGSLREFSDRYLGKISDEVFELSMHLIAAHHGRGRPHFPRGGFDPDTPARSPKIAGDVIRRFARLQRKHGYWQLAWLENLLRCADVMASSEGK
jgi:CRISPR-associated endonuclease/helicase Cas3